jgi:hypothetical protein
LERSGLNSRSGAAAEQEKNSDWVYKWERKQHRQEGVERGKRAAPETDLRISEDLTPNT